MSLFSWLKTLLGGGDVSSSSNTSTSSNTATNPDGSTTVTRTESRTVNGVAAGTRTVSTTAANGTVTKTVSELRDGVWVEVAG